MGILKQQTLATTNSSSSGQNFTITIYYMIEAVRDMQPNTNELVFNSDTMNKLYETGLLTKPDSATFVVPIQGVRGIIKRTLSLK